MQPSVNRLQNHGSSVAEAGRATCPACGHSFACGGEVGHARGGEVEGQEQRKKGHGYKTGMWSEGGEVEPTAWKKRDTELPRHELNVYRGEGVPRGEESEEEDEDKKKLAYAREIRRKRGY